MFYVFTSPGLIVIDLPEVSERKKPKFSKLLFRCDASMVEFDSGFTTCDVKLIINWTFALLVSARGAANMSGYFWVVTPLRG